MSCPDWKLLVHAREAEANPFAREDAPLSPAWQEALEHLDGGCADCRRAALSVDPLLVFRRLPVLEMSAESEEREVASMQRAVAAMRTASRLEGPSRPALNWRRWAAAAVLAILGLSAGPWRVPGAKPVNPESTLAGAAASAARPGPGFAPGMGSEMASTVEAVENRPDARVYQMDGDGISVTMIVDESLDV